MAKALLSRLSRWLLMPLLASTGVIGLLLAVTRLRTPVLLAIAAVMVLAGFFQLFRAAVHWGDPEYQRHPSMRRLVRLDLRLSFLWIAAAVLLGWMGTVVSTPVAVPLLGSAVTLLLAISLFRVAADTVIEEELLKIPGGSAHVAQWPGVRRWRKRLGTAERYRVATTLRDLWGPKVPMGQVSVYLATVVAVMFCISGAYAGLAAAEAITHFALHVQPDSVREAPPLGRSGGSNEEWSEPEVAPRPEADQGPPPPPTYAELCEELPDPQDVGAGLGDLFERDGAVVAGCGQEAESVGSSTFMAAGLCEGELRSLAVGSPGREAVLLYGDAARFAREAGDMGMLRYAEVVSRQSGEVDVVGAVQGSYAFVRSSPALSISSPATHCTDVKEIDGAFAQLPPPLARLWGDHVREHGWSWPEEDPDEGASEFVFREPLGNEVVAEGSCESDSACLLDGLSGPRRLESPQTIALAELGPHMP